MDERRKQIVERIELQLDRAYAKHGRDPWGRHEFYGVLKEEVDELWDAVKADADTDDVLAEAMQIACVCIRYAETGDRYRGPHTVPTPHPAPAAEAAALLTPRKTEAEGADTSTTAAREAAAKAHGDAAARAVWTDPRSLGTESFRRGWDAREAHGAVSTPPAPGLREAAERCCSAASVMVARTSKFAGFYPDWCELNEAEQSLRAALAATPAQTAGVPEEVLTRLVTGLRTEFMQAHEWEVEPGWLEDVIRRNLPAPTTAPAGEVAGG